MRLSWAVKIIYNQESGRINKQTNNTTQKIVPNKGLKTNFVKSLADCVHLEYHNEILRKSCQTSEVR